MARRLILAAAVLLGGCASEPWSALNTRERVAGDALSHPLVVHALDGRLVLEKPEYELAPGSHVLRLRSSAETAINVPMMGIPFTIDVKPCTRHFIAAQHEPPPSERWTLRTVREEPIEDCP